MTHQDAALVLGRLARSAQTLGEGGPDLDQAFQDAARVLAAAAQAEARGVPVDLIVRVICELRGDDHA